MKGFRREEKKTKVKSQAGGAVECVMLRGSVLTLVVAAAAAGGVVAAVAPGDRRHCSQQCGQYFTVTPSHNNQVEEVLYSNI